MLPFTRPSIDDEEQRAAREVLGSGWLASGPKVGELEQQLEAYLQGGVGVRLFSSGTGALEAALLATGIGPGDEVIVPAMSFVATANVVVRCGARPVFVDVDPVTRNLSRTAVAASLTSKTKAVIPVHFAGRGVDLGAIHELVDGRDVTVIEDAAQAIGTQVDGRRVGSSGNPVCFSFHPNKNMTTIEGGAVACSDHALLKRIEAIRFHGIERDEAGEMDVSHWGGKMNLSDVGAAIGLVQLRRLDSFNVRRRILARRYLEHLPRHAALLLPADAPGHSWHMFCICIDYEMLNTSRTAFQQRLMEQGIGSGIHYPAIHLFSLYRGFGYGSGDFPVAEMIGEQTLTLPLFPSMSEQDVDRVCEAIGTLLGREHQA